MWRFAGSHLFNHSSNDEPVIDAPTGSIVSSNVQNNEAQDSLKHRYRSTFRCLVCLDEDVERNAKSHHFFIIWSTSFTSKMSHLYGSSPFGSPLIQDLLYQPL